MSYLRSFQVTSRVSQYLVSSKFVSPRQNVIILCVARRFTTRRYRAGAGRVPGLRVNAISLSNTVHYRQFSTLETQDETIFALSTAPGRAAIAVVRVSGPACAKVYQRLCQRQVLPEPRKATLRALMDPTDVHNVLDPAALVFYFPGPRSVTGEDVLEFHVHGSPAVVQALLQAIPECSKDHRIRSAEPGEFTKRAFYNDRLSLPQIEALGDTLAAETEQQRRLAVSGSDGRLTEVYESWRQLLLDARGELEALIDFSEDQQFEESPSELLSGVTSRVQELRQLMTIHLQNAMRGELMRNGFKVTLIGAPNAGKSSLLNQIVGREAAIVSAQAGTTRDIVEVGLDVKGWLVRLSDTAGLRKAGLLSGSASSSSAWEAEAGQIEREGIRRATARALESDLVMIIFEANSDGTAQLHESREVREIAMRCLQDGKEVLVVVNKIDVFVPTASAAAGFNARTTSPDFTTDKQQQQTSIISDDEPLKPPEPHSLMHQIQLTRDSLTAAPPDSSSNAAAAAGLALPGLCADDIYFVSCLWASANETSRHREGVMQQMQMPRPNTTAQAAFPSGGRRRSSSGGGHPRPQPQPHQPQTNPTDQLEADPGGIQALLQGMAQKFTQMTAPLPVSTISPAADAEEKTLSSAPSSPLSLSVSQRRAAPAHRTAHAHGQQQQQGWAVGLGATARQRGLLEQCLADLEAFMQQATTDTAAAATPTTATTTATRSGNIPVTDKYRDGSGINGDASSTNAGITDAVDVVVAAEHLRAAAQCLAQITGKGLAGDVEDVLGVVFANFCVGK